MVRSINAILLLVLQVYDDTEEGYEVFSFYDLSCKKKPVTLVIDPQTTEPKKWWEGFIDAQVFVEVRW